VREEGRTGGKGREGEMREGKGREEFSKIGAYSARLGLVLAKGK